MRRVAWISASIAGVLVLLLVAGLLWGVWTVRRSFPQVDGELRVPSLGSEAVVQRDAYGVPQVYADTAEDLFRAQGYVHAQDRFWEMDFRRHVTAGRLSELFGESQVETDTFVRTLGWRRVAEAELQLLAPTTRRWLDSYAEGVNAYLEERSGAELSLEYAVLGVTKSGYRPEPWSAADSVAWLKAMAWDLRSNLEHEINRALLAAELPVDRVEELYPPYPYDRHRPITDVGDDVVEQAARAAPHALLSAAGDSLTDAAAALSSGPNLFGSAGSGLGSNSWVVAGSRTTTGKPLLANDPHLGPQMPSLWYQMGLHCRVVTAECPFRVAGYTFSGLPGVIIGHNERLAWGLTNLAPDVADLYLERVEGEAYAVPGGTAPLDIRREQILVTGGEPVDIEIRSTRHGPLISDASEESRQVGDAAPAPPGAPARSEGYEVALKWTALEPGRTADAVFEMNRAQDWPSFREAARLFEVPAHNIVYADVDGHIGYQAPGKIPVRSSGDGRWPAAGWTDDQEWVGYVPFEQLPSVLDPPEGYIVTANNAIAGPSYPVFITADWDYGYRSERIRQLVESSGTMSPEQMDAIQTDSHNPLAELLVPHLLAQPTTDAWYAEGLDLLRHWDYSQPDDSPGAAFFNASWRAVLLRTFGDELPADRRPDGGSRWFEVMRVLLEQPDNPWWDDVRTETVRESRDAVLATVVQDAKRELTQLLGKDVSTWSWGRLHELTVRNQSFGQSGVGIIERLFNRGPLETGGGPSIVLANGWDAGQGYETVWVPSMRMIVDMGDLDRSRWINLTGASGHAFSDHYFDQAELWQEGDTTPWPWTQPAVDEATRHTLLLLPG